MTFLSESQLLLIFGASGDLTHRKLLPALFQLYKEHALPNRFLIIGTARTRQSTETFRNMVKESISSTDEPIDAYEIQGFLRLIYYVTANPNRLADYEMLFSEIEQLRRALDIDDNIIYYLATPPTLYAVIPKFIREMGQHCSDSNGWRRIIIEKPYGNNEAEAKILNATLHDCFNESDIYRIDHYLGKETVQNILVLRFANEIWEPAWSRLYIDHVTLTAIETLGIGNRGRYYESAGALRDMIQNHLLQILSFITMETPSTFTPEAIRDETAKLFRSLRPFTPEAIDKDIIRAQYTESIIDGHTIAGYRDEAHVAPDSTTETFVAMRCYIDNRRWSGVPFYFFTGKRLAEKRSEVVIYFRNTPQPIFPGQCAGDTCNRLIIRLYPNEGIDLQFGLKRPGSTFNVMPVEMEFDYKSLPGYPLSDAYRRLLLDAMHGESLLYAGSESLLKGWRFIDPIEKRWSELGSKGLQFYPAGSIGPAQGLELCPDGYNNTTVCHHQLTHI